MRSPGCARPVLAPARVRFHFHCRCCSSRRLPLLRRQVPPASGGASRRACPAGMGVIPNRSGDRPPLWRQIRSSSGEALPDDLGDGCGTGRLSLEAQLGVGVREMALDGSGAQAHRCRNGIPARPSAANRTTSSRGDRGSRGPEWAFPDVNANAQAQAARSGSRNDASSATARLARPGAGCDSGCRGGRTGPTDHRGHFGRVVERLHLIADGVEDQRGRLDLGDLIGDVFPIPSHSRGQVDSPCSSTVAGARRTSASAPRSHRG